MDAPTGIDFPEPVHDGEKRVDPAAHPNMSTHDEFAETIEVSK